MRAHAVIATLVGLAVVVAGAVAIARSSTDTNVSSFAKARPPAATCPKLEWPYGCDWRQANSGNKRLAVRGNKHRRLSMKWAMTSRP
jgi:hypothetical protein